MPQPSASKIVIQANAIHGDRRIVVERREGRLAVVENAPIVERKEVIPETQPRPPAHNHEQDDDTPVFVTDFHGTLAPIKGFPLTEPPFPGVKALMDLTTGRGCCWHIATASLYDPDPEIIAARTAMLTDYCRQHGLPISFIGPKVPADVYLDDRAVQVGSNPDWEAIADAAEAKLLETFEIGDDGKYVKRDDLNPVGEKIEDWPDPATVPGDSPRGFSTPVLDCDIHRVLNGGWGSSREEDPDPQAVAFIQRLYDEGYTIHVSCAGFNPMTHPSLEAAQKLARMRQWMRQHAIPFDQFVGKDDSTIYLDNLAVPFTTWSDVDGPVTAALEAAGPVPPQL